MKLRFLNAFLCLPLLFCVLGCKTSKMESTARTLNRDLDLERSPYQYKVSDDEARLVRVLRKMPVGQTIANEKLRADIEKAIESQLGASPTIVEIRIFETQPGMRREVWVAEHEHERVAFDVIMQQNGRRVDFTVKGPVKIEGAL